MADAKTYNGWTNWETWQINLWLDNEESSYRDKQRFLRKVADWLDYKPDDYVENEIICYVNEAFPEGTPDMDPGDMLKVDWSEIVESFKREAKEP
jgi:hypothetical protein